MKIYVNCWIVTTTPILRQIDFSISRRSLNLKAAYKVSVDLRGIYHSERAEIFVILK
jgi:hypothetical protein